jgi:hypothetical protein
MCRLGYNGNKNCAVEGAVKIDSEINPALNDIFWCRKE